jgi:hypothetical protein
MHTVLNGERMKMKKGIQKLAFFIRWGRKVHPKPLYIWIM